MLVALRESVHLETLSDRGREHTSYKTSSTLPCREAEAVSVRFKVFLKGEENAPPARRGEAWLASSETAGRAN